MSLERLLRRKVAGGSARNPRKYLVGRGMELWTWVGTSGLASINATEQGLGSPSREEDGKQGVPLLGG